MKQHYSLGMALAAMLLLPAALPVLAQASDRGLDRAPGHDHFVFTKVADFTTPVPGRHTTFGGFNPPPSVSGEDVAFQAFDTNLRQGIYLASDGNLQKVADNHTPFPGGKGNFAGFITPPMLSGDNLVIEGFNAAFHSGIFLFSDDALNIVADTHTRIPGGVGKFIGFGPASLDGDQVAFAGTDKLFQSGIYLYSDGLLRKVVDQHTSLPGGTGKFAGVGDPALSGENIAFPGSDGVVAGIYLASDGSLTKLLDTNTPIPSGSGKFIEFGPLSIGGRNVAFVGISSLGEEGIYLSSDGKLHTVADGATPVPGGTGTLSGFGTPSVNKAHGEGDGGDASDAASASGRGDGGDSNARGVSLAFEGIDTLGNDGVYLLSHGKLEKVVATNDKLAGKTVISGSAPSLSGNHLAFVVLFSDGSRGLYNVTIQHEQGD